MSVPLETQIAEVQRELALRRSVYPSMVARERLTQAEADTHRGNMEAVLATLEWLQRNEAAIKARTGEAT